MTTINNREPTLDILRGAGLLMVILAHCQIPDYLYQLRDFDIPLLVVVSAATFAMLYKNKSINATEFIIKRGKKLILSAWLFLTFFFCFVYGFTWLKKIPFPYSMQIIFESYGFYYGIGFVWILRIFMFIALFTPYLLYFKNKVKNNYIYTATALGILLTGEIIGALLFDVNPTREQLGFFGTVVLPILPYTFLYMYGQKLEEISIKWLVSIATLALIIFLSFLIYYKTSTGELTGTEYLKYPPRLYYISYGIFAITSVYLVIKNYYPKQVLIGFWQWISAHSLWVYLWHILGIYLWNFYMIDPDKDFIISLAKYVSVLSFACAITLAQDIITRRVRS